MSEKTAKKAQKSPGKKTAKKTVKKDLAKVSGKKTESVFTPLTEAEKNANQAEVVRLLSQNEELELGKKDYAASVNKTVKDNKKTISELCREVKKGKETFKGVQK